MMYKYKIVEEMDKLNLAQYKYATRELPKLMGVAFNTFHNYKKLKVNDTRDIPYGNVVMLEQFFGLGPGELSNVKYEVKTIQEQMPY